MNLKRVILTDKFNDENSFVSLRWINNTIQTNIKMYQHSWGKETVGYLVQLLVKQFHLCVNYCVLENYYQDRENTWWISNEGVAGGYRVLDQISYFIGKEQHKPLFSVHMQKRNPVDKSIIKIPTVQTMSRYYNSKRYHLAIGLSESVCLHITIPLKTNGKEGDLYQVWMDFPVQLGEAEYVKMEEWYKEIYTILTQRS